MTKNTKKTEPKADAEVSKTDEVLNGCVGKPYMDVMVLGVMEDGRLDIQTSNAIFPVMHHILNRAFFEMSVYESNMVAQNIQKASEEAKQGKEVENG